MMNRRSPIFAPLCALLAIAMFCGVILPNSSILQVNAEPIVVGSRDFPIKNEIDKFILLRLQEDKVEPSATCTDEEFCRRVHLDVLGTIPTRGELKAFLASSSPDKRAKLVDSVLASNERYADHWSVMWSDLLREHTNSKQQEGTERGSYHNWIKQSLEKNMPYDQFFRELVTCTQSADENPAVNFYLRDEQDRSETTNTVSTVFMGTRMACAQCHDHPFDKWTQNDFHSVMSFFARTAVVPDPSATLVRVEKARGLPEEARKELEPYFKEAREAEENHKKKMNDLAGAGGDNMAMMGMMDAMKGMGKGFDALKHIEKTLPPDQAQRTKQVFQQNQVRQVIERPMGEYKMPADGDAKKKSTTGEVVEPVFPWDQKKKAAPTANRRKALADFVIGSHQFAEVQVNRIWAQLMGRGIVDPTDDFRPKNPPTHPELLSWLADEFIKAKFNNKHVIKLILNSSTYQRSSAPTASNKADTTLYSHQKLRRLTAEQMFDSILVATGREKGLANTAIADVGGKIKERMGMKNEPIQWAVDLPTPARTGTFMNTFNQPNRDQIVAKREDNGSISQALELLNGKAVNDPIHNSPLIREMMNSKTGAANIVNEIYLSVLSRNPSEKERAVCMNVLKSPTPPQDALEDLMWALLNAREFAFNR